MIHDVDESLRALVRRDVLNEAGIEVSFDAPTKDWSTRRNAPALNIYLYEIREDLTRRGEQFEEQRDERGRVTSRRPPPRKFKLSYLITAWTQRAEDEHRLLSAVLTCFLGFDAIPTEVLQGELAEQGEPVRVTIALPLAPDRSITDVWTALGGELKPSLDLIVTCPFDTGRRMWVGPPVLEEPRIGVGRIDGEVEGAAGNGNGSAAGRDGGPRGAKGGAGADAGPGEASGGKGGKAAKGKRHEAGSGTSGQGQPAEGAGPGGAGPGDEGPGDAGPEGTRIEGESPAAAEPKPTAAELIQGGRGPQGRKFRIQELPR
jgi:hypothetical protein